MNILYLTQFFSSNRAGGPLIFYNLAKTMASRGHKVYVICNLSTENINQKDIVIRVVEPKLRESNQLPPSIFQNLRYITNCIIHGKNLIKEHKIDLIHSNSFTPIIAGSLLGRLTKIPVVSAVLDVFTDNEFGSWDRWVQFNKLPKYYAAIGNLLEKISLTMPSNIIHTISETTKQDIIKVKANARTRVIYPGIDTSAYKTHIRREYGDLILFIGRLVFYKNVDVLIRAFRYVIQDLPHAQLVIVGEGPMKETWKLAALEADIHRNISFLGNVSTLDKIQLLNRCSALALPSLFEGFGLVILEAFAMAKPVLVSNVKPFDEIVDDGTDGFILPGDDPIKWSERIKYLLLDKSICKRMGESGLPKVHNKFNFEKSMDQMESLYKELVQIHKDKS